MHTRKVTYAHTDAFTHKYTHMYIDMPIIPYTSMLAVVCKLCVR